MKRFPFGSIAVWVGIITFLYGLAGAILSSDADASVIGAIFAAQGVIIFLLGIILYCVDK